ncbi:MAG: S8 family serine peptidase [Ignavibacteria bacterium]|nr:S8 family serine peptidase [Ignavibacteria bacterium]
MISKRPPRSSIKTVLSIFFLPLIVFNHVSAQTPPQGYPVGIVSSGENGALSLKALPPGSTVVSIVKGDSILASTFLDTNEKVKAIIQFSNPPLAHLINPVTKTSTGKIRAAQSLMREEHNQFQSDLAQIEAAGSKNSRNTLSIAPTQIWYEYSVALNGVAVTTSRWVLEELAKLPYVKKINPDGEVHAFDDASNAVIGAPSFWGAYSLHGEGIDIAIIDTGIDYFHEMLGGAAFPNTKVVGGYDIVNKDSDPMDDQGHGTHVAGIAAGDGSMKGVAYKARLWAFKVLDSHGSGSFSDVIEGIERALDPDNDPATPTPIEVINMSLGGAGSPDDPVSQAVDNAVASGVVCAIAAGNSGPSYTTVGSPGAARRALTVGATDNADAIATFSSRGPTDKQYLIKPDVVAPGVSINSAKSGGGYILHSGTSMATPHVAGAAALLRQLHPGWTPDEIKATLMSSAKDLNLNVWTQGAGRIDLIKAGQESTLVLPASLSLGLVDNSQSLWTKTESLTVYNHKSTSENFIFSIMNPPPPGVSITFTPSEINVPAGGNRTFTTTLTVDNTVFGYPATEPSGYENKIVAQSVTSSDSILVPCAFIKSPFIRFIFDVSPEDIFIHNRVDKYYFVTNMFGSFNDTMDFLIPQGTYDVLLSYYDDNFALNTNVVKENIAVTGTTVIQAHKADAQHAISLRMLDVSGKEFPSFGSAASGLVHKASEFGVFTLGPFSPRHYFTDVSNSYTFEVKVSPFTGYSNEDYYEIPFSVPDGVSSSMTLQNDPGDFKEVDYSIDVPEGTEQARFYRLMTNRYGTGVVGGESILGPPFKLKGYFLPHSESFTFRFTWSDIFTDDIFLGNAKRLFHSGYMTVVQPDTAKFYVLPYQSSVASVTSYPIEINMGRTAPWWRGRAAYYSNPGVLVDNPSGGGFFLSPTGDVAITEVPYKFFLNESLLIRSGILDNSSGQRFETFLSASSGSYLFQMNYDKYRIGGVQGNATARLRFTLPVDWGKPFPYLQHFQVLASENTPDSLPSATVNVIPRSGFGVKSVELYYRSFGADAWIPLSLAIHDSTYSAYFSNGIKSGVYSLKLIVADSLSNLLEYTTEPAFEIPGFYVTPRTIAFGDVEVACRSTATFMARSLYRYRTISLHANPLNDSNFVVGTTLDTYQLSPGDSSIFSITFSPTSPGLKQASIILSDGAGSVLDTIVAEGTGTGASGAMLISPRYSSGWQLISLPVEATCPYNQQDAFEYTGIYTKRDTLEIGRGYWKKLRDSVFTFTGYPVSAETIHVKTNWNIIGSISTPVPTTAIRSIPDSLIKSYFFHYDNGYSPTDMIYPGHGYWVRVSGEGNLILLSSSASQVHKGSWPDLLVQANRLTITDAMGRSQQLYLASNRIAQAQADFFALPPAAPGDPFDARFGSGKILEVVDWLGARDIPIKVSSARYPLRFVWEFDKEPLSATLLLGDEQMALSAKGDLVLAQPVNEEADHATLYLRILGGNQTPKVFSLEQNYPNPFNPSTVIRYSLPVTSRVRLRVFNLLGQEVKTLVDGIRDAGYESAEWDASGVASGVYFYRIEATSATDPSHSFTQVRKMVLLK